MSHILMVTAQTRGSEEDPGVCLGIRFCDVNDVKHMEDLLIKQVRRRYPQYRDMKPREIRAELLFTVYEVPNPPGRGFPKWLGETGWYY